MTGKITQFPDKKSGSNIRSFLGFEYNKFSKDKNGISFREKQLRDYSGKNKYIITIMRKINNEVYLYDFYVKNADIEKFFKGCFDGKIEGEIVEIEKCKPEILA